MRLFIYELICAGGLGSDVPESLRREGAAMLQAIVEDFDRIPELKVYTLLAEGFSSRVGRHSHRAAPADEPHMFREVAVQADAALIIAPEFDEHLTRRTGWAIDAGCRILGCNHDAIRLAGDKLRFAHWLSNRQVATPATHCLPGMSPPAHAFPCVLKPRHGAGSQATFLIQAPADWNAACNAARAEWPGGELVVQPYHAGQAASVACLVGPQQVIATPGATQRLSDDGRFRYLGGTAPLPPALRVRAVSLARRAVESVPGLLGYVGVDLILGDAADGSQDVVIEINPRLTTSYIGLRQLTNRNLAELWLRLWQGEEVVEPEWSESPIEFTTDGRVTLAV
jgi:hypothetical protein